MPGGVLDWRGHGVVNDDYLNATIKNGLALDVDVELGRQPLQVDLDGLDERKILEWWKQYKKNPQFAMIGRNCSSTATDALAAGGAETMFIIPTPSDIYYEGQQIKAYGPGWHTRLTLNPPGFPYDQYTQYVLH